MNENKLNFTSNSIQGVFAGVGAFFLAQAGATACFESKYKYSSITGSSGGAINAAFIACNFSIIERENILFNLNINELLDNYLFGPLALLDNNKLAMIAGDKLYNKFKQIFSKNNIPLKFKDTNIPLAIPVTNIDERKCEIFSTEKTPDMEIALAIRMSLSIPGVFTPVIYKNKKYIDAGLTKNFYIDRFQKDDPNVVGFRVYDDNDFDKVNNIKDLLSASFFTAVLQNEKDSKQFNKNALYVEIISDFDLFNFKELDKKTIQRLYLDGYKQMSNIIGKV